MKRIIIAIVLGLVAVPASAAISYGFGAIYGTADEMPCKHYHFECGGFETEFDMSSLGFKLFAEADLFGDVDLRLSLGSLNKYKVIAQVNGDNDTEELIDAVGSLAAQLKPSDMQFTTTGATHFVSLTGIFNYRKTYFEIGPTCYMTEQQIHIIKPSIGLTVEWKKDIQTGCGYMAALGARIGNFTVSIERFDINAGNKTGDQQFKYRHNHIEATGARPSGVNGVTALMVGYLFTTAK